MDTKTPQPGQGNRRKRRRVPMKLPVRVRGRNPDGSVFSELTSCDDACEGGVSIRLRHPVRQGQFLHLSLPLPARFRQYNLTDHSYRVYGLVRSVTASGEGGARVGLLFYGKRPPSGEEALPTGLFLMPGDSGTTGQRSHAAVALTLRLAAQDAPGAVGQEERAVAESVRSWSARVRICSLPVMTGAMVLVEDAGCSFQTRAEVRHVLIGPDGGPRLDLVFLDAAAPECLQTDEEAP